MGSQRCTPVIDYLRGAAHRFPDRLALVGPDEVTYASLYDRVQRWAGGFAAAGLTSGERVAIWLPKCTEYLVALYGALEVGAAYVPLDGSQPAPRAGKILASAAPRVLVTDSTRIQTLAGVLPDSIRLVVLIDELPSRPFSAASGAEWVTTVELDRSPATVLDSGRLDSETPGSGTPAPDDLAAILFTSGSTGVPKGVQISHENLHSFIRWTQQEFHLCEADVFANHAGFHFDLSTFDFFAAAAVGAGVWIVRESEQRDVASLLEGIQRYQVSVWYSVPSVLALLVSSGALDKAVARSLRYVLFAGEVFPINRLRALRECLPSACELYNLYGPTETNVCLFHRVREEDLLRDRPVYIGRPLPGVQVRIIDSNGREVWEEGVVGELVVGGPCVTPGYWRMEDSRNHKNHHGRWHATGDLVCLEAGLVEYRGRCDRMLKIQGNRVELGEVEAALSTMADIGDVAVVVEWCNDTPALVAFYSEAETGRALSVLDIKRYCSNWLPRYMIPRRARCLEALPRNANGKIDYRTLERLVAEPASEPQVITPPVANREGVHA